MFLKDFSGPYDASTGAQLNFSFIVYSLTTTKIFLIIKNVCPEENPAKG